MQDIFAWIDQELSPDEVTTEDLIYQCMASQSGRSLPIIYQPFDIGDRGHWADRGAALDFVAATRIGDGSACNVSGRMLDFGPGDGWPSLIVAPWVDRVIGVEGSLRRVAVCTQNAARLGITNAQFVHVEPGSLLPFDSGSFDAAVAASSVEQSPDPRTTLAELYRVLRPGGRLRLSYEALGVYQGGHGRDFVMWEDCDHTHLILYDRHIALEETLQVRITFDMPRQALTNSLAERGQRLGFSDITAQKLAQLRDRIVDAGRCRTQHPSGTTLCRWLTEIGFRQVSPTHNGVRFAGALFDQIAVADRPASLEELDVCLRPMIAVVVDMPAPITTDPWITAVK